MRTIAKRPPRYFRDGDGIVCVSVPLASGGAALLHAIDFEDLLSGGVTPNWTQNSNGSGKAYVRAEGSDNLVSIGRLIVRARAGQCVRYRNRATHDLRRENLYVTDGGRTKRRKRA